MTVGELIEELQKYPSHHRVFVESIDWQAEPRHDGLATEFASIADVRADDACSVIIDATGGIQ